MDDLDEGDIKFLYKTCIDKGNYHSAPGPDGLRYSHLQHIQWQGDAAALHDALDGLRQCLMGMEELDLPSLFYSLFTSATLDGIGQKARPIACGNVIRRLLGSVYMQLHKGRLARRFEEVGQYGVASASGTEKVALLTRMWHEGGHWVVKGDVANAYNNGLRTRILEGAMVADPTIVPFATHTYAGKTSPSLHYRLPGAEPILSCTGTQQGDSIAGLLFCCLLYCAMLKWKTEAHAGGHLPHAAYADDIMYPSRGRGAFTRADADDFKTREADLLALGLPLNRGKCEFLPPPGHVPTAEERRLIEEELGGTIAEGGILAAGVPVGSDDFVRDHLRAKLSAPTAGTPAVGESFPQLVGHIAAMEDRQSATVYASLCLPSRWTYLARSVDPDLLAAVAAAVDVYNAWTLEQVMGLPGSRNADDILSLEKAVSAALVLQPHQTLQLALPTSMGGIGITSLSHVSRSAYVAACVENFGAVLAPGVTPDGERRTHMLEQLPFTKHVRSLRDAIAGLLAAGIAKESLALIVPAEWIAATEAGDAEGLERLAAALPAHSAHHGGGGNNRGGNTGGGGDDDGEDGGDGPPRHTQRRICQLYNKCLQGKLLDLVAALPTLDEVRQSGNAMESREQALARIHSQRGKHAMAFVAAPPRPLLLMAPTEARDALKRALGVWTIYAEQSTQCPYHNQRPPRHAVDNIAGMHHAITCALCGLSTTAHHEFARVLRQVLAVAGVAASQVRVEDPSCFDGPVALAKAAAAKSKGKSFAMDLVLVRGSLLNASDESLRARNILVDASIANPAAVSHISNGSAECARVAAAAVETKKCGHYEGTYQPLLSKLVPFVVESYGHVGDMGREFIKQLVDNAMGDTRASQRRATLVHKLYQILSVGLQRALSRRESAYRDKLRDHGILPPGVARSLDPLWDLALQSGFAPL
jgi:hypothetical protein